MERSEKLSAGVSIFRPKLVDPEKSSGRLRSVSQTGTFSNFGAQSRSLEAKFAEFLGVGSDQVVMASSATTALHGALQLSKCASWRVPSWTFPATPLALVAARKSFIFSDVSRKDWKLKLGTSSDDSVGELLVLPFGVGLREFSWGSDTEVVVDAAASLGEMEGGMASLPQSTSVIFSLHATKVLGVGEGGIAVFGDSERAQEFRAWTNFGFKGSRVSSSLGYNAKMSEYVAAFLHTELDHWAQTRDEWFEARQHADEQSDKYGLVLQPLTRGIISPYWNVIFESKEARTAAQKRLAKEGVETRRWWGDGCHTNPAFSAVPREPLSNTIWVSERTLGLPFYRGIGKKTIQKVLEAFLTK